jgi:hypothetical protein
MLATSLAEPVANVLEVRHSDLQRPMKLPKLGELHLPRVMMGEACFFPPFSLPTQGSWGTTQMYRDLVTRCVPRYYDGVLH